MKRLAIILALALVVALPQPASAKKKASPMPGAATTAGLSATVPACPASDPAVWVNTSSKIYWTQGTEWYGKTKHGGYACTSAAVAMGARAPKASAVTKGGAMGTATAVPMGKKKHQKTGAMPAPVPSP